MKRSRPTADTTGAADEGIVLGLVILPVAGRLVEAMDALRLEPDCEVADPIEHRIPVVIECGVGEDELRIRRLRSVPSILSIDVAYAEILSEGRPR